MTSYPRIVKSPYLVGFMLAALMVWSLSAITKTMDGALQRTQFDLRVPAADIGAALHDSAITLKHRLRPVPAATSEVNGNLKASSDVARRSVRSLGEVTVPVVAVVTPVTAPQLTALAGLVTSASVDTKRKKLKQKRVSQSSHRSPHTLRPASSRGNGSASGKGHNGDRPKTTSRK